MRLRSIIWTGIFIVVKAQASAETPQAILQSYETVARRENQGFAGFSAARGRDLYLRKITKTTGEISCTSCHTHDPKASGRTRANKEIDPLAPVINPKRFTDPKHVEKWFNRNCDDVLSRACTALEKGDFITYMLSIK